LKEQVNTEAGKVRSFIAIELPLEVKTELDLVERRLEVELSLPVKWVEPSNIHLTLKFLGNIPQTKVPQIADAIVVVARDISPFSLELGEPGVFPNPRRPRVIWIGLRGEIEKAISLQRSIDGVLESMGFARESRPFAPHLTLARVRERPRIGQQDDLAKLLVNIKPGNRCRFEVTGVSLMRSQLTPRGAIYTELALADLGG